MLHWEQPTLFPKYFSKTDEVLFVLHKNVEVVLYKNGDHRELGSEKGVIVVWSTIRLD